VICWENYMPLLRTAMYAKHSISFCAPTADDTDNWPVTMLTSRWRAVLRAVRLPVHQAWRVPGGFDAILGNAPRPCYALRQHDRQPAGEVLAGPNLRANALPPTSTRRHRAGQVRFDVVGHYARPDVFRLLVDESASPRCSKRRPLLLQIEARAACARGTQRRSHSTRAACDVDPAPCASIRAHRPVDQVKTRRTGSSDRNPRAQSAAPDTRFRHSLATLGRRDVFEIVFCRSAGNAAPTPRARPIIANWLSSARPGFRRAAAPPAQYGGGAALQQRLWQVNAVRRSSLQSK